MISGFSARHNPPLSHDIQLLKSDLSLRDYKQAASRIKEMKNPHDAKAVYEAVFAKNIPTCWLGLLQNPVLSDELSSENLQNLLNKADTVLKRSPQHIALCRVGLVIAKNANLCRKINYASLVPYTSRNPHLAFYICVNPDFLSHLDPQTINDLIKICPTRIKSILNNLLFILQTKDNENAQKRDWAKHVLEYLILHSVFVRMTIQSDPEEYALFIRELKHRFLHNRPFAKEVLKSLKLCTLLQVPTNDAHKHPFLTGRDFLEIGQHYMGTVNFTLASDYFLFALELEEYYANLSLVTLVQDDDPQEAWEWLQHAIKRLPKGDPQLKKALQDFYDFVREAQHFELADKVLSHLPVEDDLDDLIGKLTVEDEPPSLAALDETLSGFLPAYSSTCEQPAKASASTSTAPPSFASQILKKSRPYLYE
ncbi:hypothetical protein [Candidatus Berkiella aquae]|uniref:Uncharacterized protein n=1 Tax=Candidatus Berkiella aquae TaxID=295108 RepID=A0A0Q9YVV6_9GAMM|nr:hypothetical protein [Candidatus Berkiella aquae]MCS5710674.1 hypothetical protein [Candidatus Berkiella aquae]